MPEEETTPTEYSWKSDPLFWAYSILMFLPIVMVFVFYNCYRFDGGEFRKKGGVPKGKSIVHTTAVVDSGIYAVVRHPQYLGFILFVLALVLMSQHWLSVISWIMGSALFYRDVLREEQMSIEKFGDDYRSYMQRAPRMNLLLGVVRLLLRKREDKVVNDENQ